MDDPPRPEATEPLLEYEKLDVYRVSLELQSVVAALLPKRGEAALRDQLDRAMTSVLLNIAEGAGRRAITDKQRFYEIARGSTMEVAAIVDIIRMRTLAASERCAVARGLSIRVVQMLSKLTRPR